MLRKRTLKLAGILTALVFFIAPAVPAQGSEKAEFEAMVRERIEMIKSEYQQFDEKEIPYIFLSFRIIERIKKLSTKYPHLATLDKEIQIHQGYKDRHSEELGLEGFFVNFLYENMVVYSSNANFDPKNVAVTGDVVIQDFPHEHSTALVVVFFRGKKPERGQLYSHLVEILEMGEAKAVIRLDGRDMETFEKIKDDIVEIINDETEKFLKENKGK